MSVYHIDIYIDIDYPNQKYGEINITAKAQNKLINIVRCQPKISKTALSEYLKVSWPTVSTNIEALKKSGIFDPDEGLAINGEFAIW